jgi:hypothetical protein
MSEKYIITITNKKNEEKYEFLLSEEEFIKKNNDFTDFIYDILTPTELVDYFENSEKFIKENFKTEHKKAILNIYEVTTNENKGYGTYRGAVAIDYWEKGVYQQLIDISDQFKDVIIEEIGKAKKDKKPEIIMTDYFNG